MGGVAAIVVSPSFVLFGFLIWQRTVLKKPAEPEREKPPPSSVTRNWRREVLRYALDYCGNLADLVASRILVSYWWKPNHIVLVIVVIVVVIRLVTGRGL